MKNLKYLLLFTLSYSLLFANCKKKTVIPVTELSKLPAATQTGANTFGCLVNGVAFVPHNKIFAPPSLYCSYNGKNLVVSGSIKNSDNSLTGIILGIDSLTVLQGNTYILSTFKAGNASAFYSIYFNTGGENQYTTNNIISGQLNIIKLNLSPNIVAGTFNFNAINSNYDTVKITNGRFDMTF